MKNRKQIKVSLYEKNKKLAKEWHTTKNIPLTPKDVSPYSGRKVWWLCSRGHSWQAVINNRARRTGCPYCKGSKPNSDNCLQAVNPGLAKQWHPTKNVPLTPNDVLPGTDKKVWWMCAKGHEWQARVNSRNHGTGCPHCLIPGRKITKNNCLRLARPKLAKEWHPTKNKGLTPNDVALFSNINAWWVCRKGHEWCSKIAYRSLGTGCPYCAGKKADRDNCLQTINPCLSRQWYFVKNAPLSPKDVTPNSHKKVWWKCKKGHEWQAVIKNRHSQSTGCPYCSGRRATKENCLETVQPRLAREWHPELNAPLNPVDVTYRSTRVAWWRCRKGHEWREEIRYRVRGRACPICVLKEKSPHLF